MKFQIIFITFFIVVCVNGLKLTNRGRLFKNPKIGISNVKDLWFNQTLDHFNPSDTRKWNQRYFVNESFYKPGGPVFLQIGGEGEANPLWMSQGAWIDYAQSFNALCFQLEHRYYGQSHPTKDLSPKNMAYLTSQQALADLASFTVAMNEKYNLTGNTKWIAFGGSYPGSLAAWYRMKYPHLVYASVSSSAPLLAQLNFVEYLGVVRDSIKRTDPECLTEIGQAVKGTEELLKNKGGWDKIKKNFNLCDAFHGDNMKDVANLFESLAGNFEDIVQYNADNRGFEGSKTANITIQTLCDLMKPKQNEVNSSSFERFGDVNNLMLKTLGQNCTDFKYGKTVKDMQQISWNSSVASGARQWTFQTCTEFGFFQSSDLPDQPFGKEFPVSFSIRQCRDFYGPKYNEAFIRKGIQWTNSFYGERNIKVSRVIFVNGSIDPWHALGIISQNGTSSDNLVIFIDGTAHCANMYPSSPNDPPQLKDARVQIHKKLAEWIQEKI